MASVKDERIHLDEYSCTLCESKAGLSLNCCCPDNPQDLLQVTEEHFRRRISLKHDQKLCADHVKKLKSGLLFGRTDWYECCAPFHVKSPRSPRLRPIPHSWKSFFESPSNNKRYHSQQRICWDCYMLAMEVINSGLDDAFDEEDIDHQSASFDFGYMSPKRWASNLSLQPNSPSSSQAGSTWSLAVQPGSLASPNRHRNISDALNGLNEMQKRARISGGKFKTPSRSFDRPSPRDNSLRVPRQSSDTTSPFRFPQRNLQEQMTSLGTDDPPRLNIEEPTSFQGDDFASIPVFSILPEEEINQSQRVEKSDVPDEGNSTCIEKKNDKSHPTVSTFNSSSFNSDALIARDQTAVMHASYSSSSNYAPERVQYVSKYIKFIYADLQPERKTKSARENTKPTTLSSEEPSPSSASKSVPCVTHDGEKNSPGNSNSSRKTEHLSLDNEECVSISRKPDSEILSVTSTGKRNVSKSTQTDLEIEQATSAISSIPRNKPDEEHALQENRDKVQTGLLKTKQAIVQSQDRNETSEALDDGENKDDLPVIPVIVVSQNDENLVQKEHVIVPVEKLQESQISQSYNNDEDLCLGTAKISREESFHQNRLSSSQQEAPNLVLADPEEGEETVDRLPTEDIDTSHGKSENELEHGREIEIGVAEERFDPIICRKRSDSDSPLSEEEDSRGSDVSNDNQPRHVDSHKPRRALFQPQRGPETLINGFAKPAYSNSSAETNKAEIPSGDTGEHGNGGAPVEEQATLNSSKEVVAAQLCQDSYPAPTMDSLEIPTLQPNKDIPGGDNGAAINPILKETTAAEQGQVVDPLCTELGKPGQSSVPSNQDRRKGVANSIHIEKRKEETQLPNNDERIQDEAYESQEEDILPDDPDKKEIANAGIIPETREVVLSQGTAFTRELSTSSNEASDGDHSPKQNGTERSFEQSSGSESEEETFNDSPVRANEQQESDAEANGTSVQTKLYTQLHSSKGETGSSPEQEEEKSDEEDDVGAKPRSGSAPNVIRTLRSGNRADDGERLQFLRRRMGNRSSSLAASHSDRRDFYDEGGSMRKSTSSFQSNDTPLGRRSLLKDKRRKLGVTFALDPQHSIVIDEPPVLDKILQEGNEPKDEFQWKEQRGVDLSELAEEDRDSESEEGDESEKKLLQKKEDLVPKGDEFASPPEDEDASAALSDIFQNVFTLKTLSDMIQSLNSGSSVQVLVMTLVSVIVVLLFLLAIFVFVL